MGFPESYNPTLIPPCFHALMNGKLPQGYTTLQKLYGENVHLHGFPPPFHMFHMAPRGLPVVIRGPRARPVSCASSSVALPRSGRAVFTACTALSVARLATS